MASLRATLTLETGQYPPPGDWRLIYEDKKPDVPVESKIYGRMGRRRAPTEAASCAC